jgi:hypothetical protein
MPTPAQLGARVIGAASKLRGERVLHPKGQAFGATVTVLPAAGWLGVALAAGPAERSAVVRLSRAVGLPDRLPDVLGLAVRIFDADGHGGVQDLMLASSGRRAGLRHLLAPRRDPLRATYTSITPCTVNGRRLLVGAFPRNVGPTGRVSGSWFDLATAPVRGDWSTFAELRLGDQLTEAESIGFDVRNNAGGFGVDPVLRKLRAAAYPAARSADH